MQTKVEISDRKSFYFTALKLINGLSPKENQILDSEAEVLSRFMALPLKHRFYPFSTLARRIVSKSFPEPLTKQNISLKIASLIDKKFLYRDEDNFVDYNPVLKQLLDSKEFNVTITNRSDNT